MLGWATGDTIEVQPSILKPHNLTTILVPVASDHGTENIHLPKSLHGSAPVTPSPNDLSQTSSQDLVPKL